jgi:hypothetical protein
MVIQAPQRAQTLPGLSLSLYERLALISRGLQTNFIGSLAKVSGMTLQSESH